MPKKRKMEEVPDPPERKKRKSNARIPAPPVPPPLPEKPPLLYPGKPEIPQAVIELQRNPGLAPSHLQRVRHLLAELARRKISALNLYEPLKAQADFHASDSRLNILRGSNRGGKTLPAAVEVARAVTGQDPHGKYPLTDGRFFCVGKDLKHVGEVMWRKLSRAGQFKILRDPHTGKWRAYRPWDPDDLQWESLAKPAPPLIPPRMIKHIAWDNKREEIPSKVVLKTGWEINFYSSLGKPPQGSDIDGWWFDEEIVDPSWFPEMVARTLDRHGRGFWSATPQAGTEVLYELHERADREKYNIKPSVREHVILLRDNPHITEDAKRKLAEDLSEEDRRVRIDGEFAFVSFRVYPQFNMLVHGVDAFDIPMDWTRYLVVDPGHQICAVLFAAVPPDSHGVYIYDELYLRDCDAQKFAIHVNSKTQGQAIQALVIDPNGAVITGIGSGKTVMQQYSEALGKEGFYAVGSGTGFVMGCDNVDAGLLAVHAWLRLGDGGKPTLRVLKGRCPSLEYEFQRYVKQRVNNQIIDKPNQRRNNHLMDDLRYLALYQPRYIKPPLRKPIPGPAVRALKLKLERKKSRDGGSFVNLGPGRVNHG